MVYIFWSAADVAEAKKIIYELLEKRLIACGSIFPQVQSIYRWKEKIEEALETKVILKTEAKNFIAIEKTIQAHSSYEIPEIVQFHSSYVSSKYASWFNEQ
jgi:periplasmic divalent cation tolerance protein